MADPARPVTPTTSPAPPLAVAPSPVPPSLSARAWQRFRAWPTWVQVLVAYAASRVLCGVVIELAARWAQNPAGVGALHPHYADLVGIWDGEWYQRIAEHGYPSRLPHGPVGAVDYNGWAFFPLFPMLVRAVMVTGLPFWLAASVVNLLAGAAAALVMWRLFAAVPGHRRLAALAVAIWCLLPPAPVLQVAYTEALAALLLAGSLLLLVRRQYLWAAPVVLLLGLTRAVAAPLVVIVVWHGVRRWRRRSRDPVTTRDRWSWTALLAVTAVSAVLWPAIVGVATGVPRAFFLTQAAWGQRPADGPFVPWLTWAWQGLGLAGVGLLLGVVAAGLHVLLGRHTAWLTPDLRAFGVVYPLYLLAVVRPITSMWRFLLLDLPIAAALASAAARGARPRVSPHWRGRLALALLLGLAALTWWTFVYLTRVPWSDSPP
ncbi:hypothetical protein [Angustibacter sp. Root456]|uniref:hypothetical protein n=1 Tax=Angustibacter sp. Root456 TaxID=1736539 RepID=UPI000A549355|nr:hypothetical protein [Angustibacter sp. Root456]